MYMYTVVDIYQTHRSRRNIAVHGHDQPASLVTMDFAKSPESEEGVVAPGKGVARNLTLNGSFLLETCYHVGISLSDHYSHLLPVPLRPVDLDQPGRQHSQQQEEQLCPHDDHGAEMFGKLSSPCTRESEYHQLLL